MLPPLARLLATVFGAHRPATRIWLATAVAAGLVLPAAPAHAQLMKRIKQAAAEKAAEAAGRKVLGEDSTAAARPAAGNGAAATARPASAAPAAPAARSTGPTKLEITPERVAQFLTAMAPTADAARERGAHAAALKKVEDYQTCMGLAGQKQTEAMMKGQAVGPTKAQEAEIERLLKISEALTERMLAAMQAGDTMKTRVLTDSSVAVSTRALALQNPMVAKMCGATPPSKPAPLDEGRLREASKPRRIDGWSPAQFGLMRERIALHLLHPDKVDMAPAERAAIDARRADLGPFLAAWKSGGMEWATWGDMWAAWR